ncbi:MAG: hypothetical protein ABI833_10150 [Acidobacteriota bacterium]
MKKNRIGMGRLAGALMLMGLIFTASPANAQRIGIGIGVGPGYYAPPPVYTRPPVAYASVAPYPGYVWTDGYYNPYGAWVGGFWGPRYGYGYGRSYGNGYRRGFVGRGYVGGRGFAGRGFVGGRGFSRGHGGRRR